MQLPVIIVGAGPAGCACAIRISALGHKAVLFEKQTSPVCRWEVCSPVVQRSYESLTGCLVPKNAATPLPAFWSCWGDPRWESMSYNFWQTGSGLLIQRDAFDLWLLDCARSAGSAVHIGCRVIGGRRNENVWTLSVEGPAGPFEIAAAFVVDATGSTSRSPIQLRAGRIVCSQKLLCLTIETADTRPTEQIAGIEASPTGWWFSAPLPTGRRVCTYFTDLRPKMKPDEIIPICRNSLRETKHVASLCDPERHLETLGATVTATSIRNLLWSRSWLAIGDAARSVDPLSGQGLARAIQDANDAAEAISASFRGVPTELEEFALNRVSSFESALRTERDFYAAERRWPSARFWASRNG